MPDVPSAVDLDEVVSSAAPLPRRASAVLGWLAGQLPFDAAWLALSDPRSREYAAVASVGLDATVTAYLDGPAAARDIDLAGLNRDRPPVSVADLPVPADDLPTWTQCLGPAGFREGLGTALFDPGGVHVGYLALFYAGSAPPPDAARDLLAQLAPVIARGLSPMHSLAASARIVHGALAGVVLFRDGSTCDLPGLEDRDDLLEPMSAVVQIARRALLGGDVFRSFLWPQHRSGSAAEHVRLTVLAATDAPAFILGALVVTPRVDCQGLTARELEVLGLLVEGRSNQEIAAQLVVSPRTVAAHVEHLLQKMGAPTRTSAAVRAERDGCYVPARPASPPRG